MQFDGSNYLSTHGQSKFHYGSFDKHHFDIDEIANALSNLCRFNGHCKQFYSVAEHSVRVSQLVPPEYALQALLHDAAKAYVGDIPTPLKRQVPELAELENRILAAILRYYGQPTTLHCEVTHANLVVLATEKKYLTDINEQWPVLNGIIPLDGPIHPLSPLNSKILFTSHYNHIAERIHEQQNRTPRRLKQVG